MDCGVLSTSVNILRRQCVDGFVIQNLFLRRRCVDQNELIPAIHYGHFLKKIKKVKQQKKEILL